MCGIHGFTWKDTDGAADRMVSAALHRGPDGSGVWGDDHITLGHNLLAISDDAVLSKQPWHHAGKVLAYNGEIYNYRDLRKLLKYQCRTDSDTEVLAAGLDEFGPDFLRRIDGMFALAWYDPPAGELILARDSNGAKPLYYGHLKGKLAFSSEIRALLTLGFPRRVCLEAFRHYYHSGLVAGPLTMFTGIHKMIPGEVVKVSRKGHGHPLFNLNDTPVTPYAGTHEALPELLTTKLRQAVSLTMTGRKEIGLFLSGGMDSTSILYELVKGLRKKPRTFTTRFELPHERCQHNADADLAAFLSRRYETTHREVVIGEREWVDDLERAVLAMEEPRQGKSHAAYYATNRLLRDCGVTVTLSGDGGDELLLGYKHQGPHPFRDRLGSLRSGTRELGNPAVRLPLEDQVEYLDEWLPKGGLTGDSVNDFMYTECLHTLSEDFLIRNDKLGAAFSMEARFPMMCRVFRDFCRSIPSGMKVGTPVKGGWSVNNKYLLRAAYEGKLPERVVKKPKTGWRAPTDDWLVGIITQPAQDGPVREYVREVLRDPRIRELFEITDDTVENLYLNNREFVGPRKDSGKPSVGPGMASQKELFSILMFAVWFKAFDMELW